MESCRLCLLSDVKMHRMVSTAQREFIEAIFKQHGFYNGLNETDYACYMCMALLHKSYNFIQMTIDAQKVLNDPLYCEQEIKFPVYKRTMCLDIEYFHVDIPSYNFNSDNINSETHYNSQIIDSYDEFDTSDVKPDYSTVQEESEYVNYNDEIDDKASIVKVPEELAVEVKNIETNSVVEIKGKRTTRNSTKLKDLLMDEITADVETSEREKCVPVRKSKRNTKLKKSRNVRKCKRDVTISKIKRDNREFPMECELCDREVINKKEHYRHYLFEHPDATYPYGYERALCPMCGTSVSAKHLTRHLRTHGYKQFKCHICPMKFTSRYTMLFHIRIRHSEPKLICDYCSKPFKTRVDIVRHIRIHTGEKPFKCHLCDAAFAHSGNRALHIRSTHQNIKIVPKRTTTKKKEDDSRKQKSKKNVL